MPLNQRGMTLLEIMLAMLVLAMVVTMVTLSISGSLDVVEATRKNGELYYRAQVALQRISEDLTSAVLVEGVEFTGNSGETDGDNGNILEFTSFAHVVFDEENDHPGLAIIAYSVQPDKENDKERVLLRSDILLKPLDDDIDVGNEDRQRYLLCDQLRSIRFSYFDEAGEELDTWNTQPVDPNDPEPRKLPVTVGCTLEFWIDMDEETSMEFTTRVLLPVGLVHFEKEQDVL